MVIPVVGGVVLVPVVLVPVVLVPVVLVPVVLVPVVLVPVVLVPVVLVPVCDGCRRGGRRSAIAAMVISTVVVVRR
ncbi:hypothetical protein FB384_000399 [Prauserella sediminis]|uniref:Uncharacterized protein n=1 Tax=Prauserella sediminis TaxID=577680 RepID=A0A839XNJ0_9PSEU|nr:hypothetical protein [Prauserella sediminis]MBB3661495.1 hypothetical protein [Prauserella sediminis]